MKRKLSFLMAVVMIASMVASVQVALAAGSPVYENNAETAADAKPWFNDNGKLVAGKGINGSNAVTNCNSAKDDGALYMKSPLLAPKFTNGKTYHMSFLMKAAQSDISGINLYLYDPIPTSKLVFADGSNVELNNGYPKKAVFFNAKTTGWTRYSVTFTANADKKDDSNFNFKYAHTELKTAGTLLADNFIIVEEDSAEGTTTVKPFVYDVKADGSVSQGEKITFSAVTYDANAKVKPQVDFKVQRSANGTDWTDVETLSATVGNLNEFYTYPATAEYTVAAADEGCFLRAVAVAKSTAADYSVVKSDEIPSNTAKSIGKGYVIDTGFDNAADVKGTAGFLDSFGTQLTDVGYDGSKCATNQVREVVYPKLMPKYTANKTYYINFLIKGNSVSSGTLNFQTLAPTGTYKFVNGNTMTVAETTYKNSDFSFTNSDWTRVGVKIDTTAEVSENIFVLKDLSTAGAVLFDEYTVLEEGASDSTDYTRPYVYGVKTATNGNEIIKSGDVLTATANTFDVNMNVKPSVKFKWQKSEDKISWTDVTETTATVGSSLNSLNTYTASSTYTVTDNEAGFYLRAVAVASSTGSVSGTKTAESTGAEIGELAPKTAAVTSGSTVNVNTKDAKADNKPSATGYAIVELPVGFSIVSYGVMLTSQKDGIIPSGIELEAQEITADGRFGVKVYGDAFNNYLDETFIMTPYAVVSDKTGNNQTINGSGMSFKLNK